MPARTTLDTYKPYADRAERGLIDFAGDFHSRNTARGLQPGWLLRAVLVAAVCLAAAASFAADGSGPKPVKSGPLATAPPPTAAHLSGTSFAQPIGSGFEQPEQIAIDSSGNLYIADVLTNNVYKETLVNGVYTQSILRANLGGPIGVAVDGKGNVYIADSDNSRVLLEELETNGTYTESVVPTSGLGGIVFDLAVDTKYNLYIADPFNNRIVKETPSGSSYTQSVIPATGLLSPEGVAVDSLGNLYIADTFNDRIVKETVSGSSYTQSVIVPAVLPPGPSGVNSPQQIFLVGDTVYIADTLNSRIAKATYDATTKVYTLSTVATVSLNAPTGVALDGSGNLFIADTNNKRVIEQAPGEGTDFGSLPIGQTSAKATLTFTFDAGGTIGAPAIISYLGGTSAFSNVGGTCTKNSTFATGKTCTILLTFRPASAGFAYAAAELKDSSNNLLASVELTGTGVGTKLFYPNNAVDFEFGTGLKNPTAMVVDRSGDVIIADTGNNQVVLEEPTSASAYEQTIVVKDLKGPNSVAVDSFGNIFITDAGNKRVLEETPATGGTYTQTVVYGAAVSVKDDVVPGSIAVDRSDNLWITFPGSVQQFSLVSGTWTKVNDLGVGVASGTKFYNLQPISLAIDDPGNLYVGTAADTTVDVKAMVLQFSPTSLGYHQTVIEDDMTAEAIAVDRIGNLFILNNYSQVNLLVPGLIYEQSGNATPGLVNYVSTILKTKTGLNGAKGLAVDANEVVYIANTGASQALNESWTYVPNFIFPETVIDQTSPAIVQSVLNIGNAAVDFTVPATGQNPSVSSPFVVNTGEAHSCPVLTASSDPASLIPGDSCSVSVSFAPTAIGTFNGSLTYKAVSNFGFSLSGQSIATIPTITWPAPASIVYGTALTSTQLDAAASYNGQTVPGTFTYSPAVGTVLNAGTQTLSVRFTPSVAGYSSTSASVAIVVTQVPLIAVADSFSRPYGSPNPTFTLSYLGFVNGDGPQSLHGAAVIGTEATSQFPWGYYPITVTPGNLTSPNYTITFIDGTLVVTQVPLTVTAQNVAVANGSEIPNPYPCTITGFVNGDTSAVVSGACATNAQSYASSSIGNYTVTPSVGTLSALNYSFTFAPGTLTLSEAMIGSGFHAPEAVAVDANGNVYVADAAQYYIVKETLANGTFTQSSIGLTPASQFGIAVDGSGNVYATSSATNEVWEWTYADGAYTSSVIANSDNGVNIPIGIAVDANGNVFVSNSGSSTVMELKPLGGGEFSVSTIANSSVQGLNTPEGLAVDANGNVYIADGGNERVVIMNYSAGSYTMGSTVFGVFDQLTGVAVDKNGNVYISAATESTVYKETLSNGTYKQSVFLASGLSAPGGVAVDANGNVYIANTGLSTVLEVLATADENSDLAPRK